MFPILISTVVFLFWAVYIIRAYYSGSYGGPSHIESPLPDGLSPAQLELYASPLTSYLIALGAIYLGYKIWTIWIMPRDKIEFGLGKIIGFFLANFVLICISFFSLPEAGTTRGFMSLFCGTLQYLLYPVLLILLTRTAGVTILNFILPKWKDEDMRVRLGIETSIGFLIFITLMLIGGMMGIYNLSFLITVILLLGVLSYPSYKDTWALLTGTYFTVDNHNFSKGIFRAINPYLLSGEFAYIILTFVMGVSFVSIFRPMPIGWDDLGVYMNFPKMIALSHTILPGSGYIAWQLITGTGFLLQNSATQAFFLNQIGGILSVIVLILAGSYCFTDPKKKYIIALPILLATLWYVLPMIVFQQAKDMKLDPALFFFSVSAVLALLARWNRYDMQYAKKESLLYLGLIGVLVGLAFTTKLTSLMLIIASVGFVSYKVLGLSGLAGFTFLFLGIFTELNLWKMMGVTITPDLGLIDILSLGCLVFSIIGYGYAFWKHSSASIVSYLKYVAVFAIGVAVPLFPWTVKHLYESQKYNQPLSLGLIIQGAGGYQMPDFTKLYNTKEIEDIKKAGAQNMTTNGQSQNEDMGRYFGYENGLNNYLKLAPNLTFQKNQPGEFTDITYVFLVLVPILFLFLRGRSWYLPAVLGTLGIFYVYWFGLPRSTVQGNISDWLGAIVLPYGYIVILAMMFLGLWGVHYGLEKNDKNTAIKDIVAFLSLYLFIYVIAAFGIVWYGIVMYFCFLLIIGVASSSFVEYEESEIKDQEKFFTKIVLSLMVFGTIAYYFVHSTFPHTWNNLRQVYYPEFKAGQLTNEAAIFKYRSDYLDPIAYMNLKDPEGLVQELVTNVKSPNLKEFLSKQNIVRPSDLHGVLSILIEKLKGNDEVTEEARSVGQTLYTSILYPPADIMNNDKIFRIGTFMTYFIVNNRSRFFEDSLLFDFNDYYYNENPAITVERMRKMGVRFFLTDLNAATIDKDPRHALTTRFENLLRTAAAKDMDLISTDSTCLKIAVEDAKKGLLTGDKYIDVAGINYESYRTIDGVERTVGRGEKRTACFNYVLEKMFKENAVSGTSYPYLMELKGIIEREGMINDPNRLSQLLNSYFGQSWFALFRVRDDAVMNNDAPSVSSPSLPQDTASGATTLSGS